MRIPAAAVLRVGWGTALVAAPRQVLRVASAPDQTRVPVLVARVLGARQIGQGTATVLLPWPLVRRVGAAADALHAATGIALALVDRRWRRICLADAVLAATFMATGLTDSTGHPPYRSPRPALRAVTPSNGGHS